MGANSSSLALKSYTATSSALYVRPERVKFALPNTRRPLVGEVSRTSLGWKTRAAETGCKIPQICLLRKIPAADDLVVSGPINANGYPLAAMKAAQIRKAVALKKGWIKGVREDHCMIVRAGIEQLVEIEARQGGLFHASALRIRVFPRAVTLSSLLVFIARTPKSLKIEMLLSERGER